MPDVSRLLQNKVVDFFYIFRLGAVKRNKLYFYLQLVFSKVAKIRSRPNHVVIMTSGGGGGGEV